MPIVVDIFYAFKEASEKVGRYLEQRNDMGNQTLIGQSSSPTVFHVTTRGVNWLWLVFALMAGTAVVIALLSMRRRRQERTLHLFNIAVLTTAAIAYYSMASNLGYAPIEVSERGPGARQVWFVRYIDWIVTTPLLLAELLLSAGLPSNIILSSIFADEVMIITGLVGALVTTGYKWGFYTFGCVAMLWVFWNIISGIKSTEKMAGLEARRRYTLLAAYLLALWTLYPLVWGLSEGSNLISVTGELVFYSILDLLAKPGFAVLTLFLHRNVPMSAWGLGFETRLERMKQHHQNGDVELKSSYDMHDANTSSHAVMHTQ